MDLPSGDSYNEADLVLLELMVKCGFIRRSDEPFTLNSGILSYVYVFGREDFTDFQDFEWLVGRKIAQLVQENCQPGDKQPCLIGIPTAGTAMAQAGAMVSFNEGIRAQGHTICHRIMRQTLKKHGAHPKWVNGNPDAERHTYWTVDNVVTNADSKFTANDRLRDNGYPVETMPSLVFVDRQQGGIQRMEKAGFKRIVVAYNLLDITFTFGELGLWPKDTVKAVEEEIAAHQFQP